jgi:hypothetical protein
VTPSDRPDDPETRARADLLGATAEDWARLEGHALGRVLDEDPPTQPLLPFDPDEAPTGPVLSVELPDWAKRALRHEGLGLGPYDVSPDTGIFDPRETLVIPTEILVTLRRRSSPRE